MDRLLISSIFLFFFFFGLNHVDLSYGLVRSAHNASDGRSTSQYIIHSWGSSHASLSFYLWVASMLYRSTYLRPPFSFQCGLHCHSRHDILLLGITAWPIGCISVANCVCNFYWKPLFWVVSTELIHFSLSLCIICPFNQVDQGTVGWWVG